MIVDRIQIRWVTDQAVCLCDTLTEEIFWGYYTDLDGIAKWLHGKSCIPHEWMSKHIPKLLKTAAHHSFGES